MECPQLLLDSWCRNLGYTTFERRCVIHKTQKFGRRDDMALGHCHIVVNQSNAYLSNMSEAAIGKLS